MAARIPALENPTRCVACGTATLAHVEPADIARCFASLVGAGWLDQARKGVGRDRWEWLCPTCRPSGKPLSGGMTTGFLKGNQ